MQHDVMYDVSDPPSSWGLQIYGFGYTLPAVISIPAMWLPCCLPTAIMHTSKGPGIETHACVQIDHPKALEYMGVFLERAAEHFGCHEALDSWILGNEVN